ncbi:hypothetical protein [Raineya orbicola]|jgi:hypothetical protein|uniref:STAS/SEC14 domain-containing protein n=1 Tax=Raineya orbicola TaxID=2016530 RepID=A0A2N3IHT6_9BACT|nr:hypothetical protein [Raineya orbicola]PKQ69877.1 hypothetical protein Rain11_1074 [Raineya orbicola]
MKSVFMTKFDDTIKAQILDLEGFYSPDDLLIFLQKNFFSASKWIIRTDKAKFVSNSLLEWIIANVQNQQKTALVLSKEFFSNEKLQNYNTQKPQSVRFFNNLLEARAWIFNA